MKPGFQYYQFSFDEVRPDISEVYDFLRLIDLEDEHPARLFVRNIFPELQSNKDIMGGYVIRDIQSIYPKQGIILIDDVELPAGKQVCGYLKDATQVALFLCTGGKFFSDLTQELNKKGDILEAYIVDAIGSITVEKAMDVVQAKLEISARSEGLSISNRYSPGYCNWALSSQRILFNLVGANPVPIRLSESSLMKPIKSVSGIIGIGSNIKKREYGCKICNNIDCIYRKIISNN